MKQGGKIKRIEVVPYNPDWPAQYEVAAKEIKEALGGNCLAVHHVGSTSVPGLAAKPTIDIIAEIKDPDNAMLVLERVGFLYKGEYNIPLRYCFTKREGVKINLHAFPEGHPEIELNLKFRDYLRAHPEAVEEYAALKYKLLEDETSFVKQEHAMYAGYTLGKHELIEKILRQTGLSRLRIIKCAHYKEWDAAKAFRHEYFCKPNKIESDPYAWTFDDPKHAHLVFYKGLDTIGYAHVQFWDDMRAALRMIVIDREHQGQGYGAQFLANVEAWLRAKGYKSLHTESSPEALAFYQSQGYGDMAFNDPDGYSSDSRDTPLGKIFF